jgi:hypothetical protein
LSSRWLSVKPRSNLPLQEGMCSSSSNSCCQCMTTHGLLT